MGIGSQLLATIEHMAAAMGLDAIHMDSSLTGADFYERRGYRRTGVNIEGTAGTQVGMVKQLGSAGSVSSPKWGGVGWGRHCVRSLRKVNAASS